MNGAASFLTCYRKMSILPFQDGVTLFFFNCWKAQVSPDVMQSSTFYLPT